MPQFWIEDFAPQLIWLLLAFGGMYFLMAKIALPKISDILEARQERIADDLDQAEELKRKAEEAIASYELALEEARTEAQAIVARIATETLETSERKNQELSNTLAEKTQEATQRIDLAKANALNELTDLTVELADLATRRLIGEGVHLTDIQRAVTAAAQRNL